MFSEFLLLTGQQHADVRTKCTVINKLCKKTFLHWQVKTAIRKSSNRGDFLKRLEQMYPVYRTDLSVRTEIEELPSLPEIRYSCSYLRVCGAAGRAHRAYKPHVLWAYRASPLAGRMPPNTWECCRETSERNAGTHSYDDLVDMLMQLAMEREKDSHMDKYMRKHLRRETAVEKHTGGRSPEPHSNPGKG